MYIDGSSVYYVSFYRVQVYRAYQHRVITYFFIEGGPLSSTSLNVPNSSYGIVDCSGPNIIYFLYFCMYVCMYHLCYSYEQSLIVLRADKMYNRLVLSIVVYMANSTD